MTSSLGTRARPVIELAWGSIPQEEVSDSSRIQPQLLARKRRHTRWTQIDLGNPTKADVPRGVEARIGTALANHQRFYFPKGARIVAYETKPEETIRIRGADLELNDIELSQRRLQQGYNAAVDYRAQARFRE